MLSNIFSFLQTVLAFAGAISILVLIHEYGHYRVAVACGVKVLRFSLGFGKPLISWRKGKDQTEFVIAPILLGGYVRMLDEREGAVPPGERHRAFNNRPVWARALVIAAGPVVNLIFAVLLFSAVAYMGYPDPKAILAQPTENSLLANAGLQDGDEIISLSFPDHEKTSVVSLEGLYLAFTQAAMSNDDLRLEVKRKDGDVVDITFPLSQFGSKKVNRNFMKNIGYRGAWVSPSSRVITIANPEGAAARAGLQNGDIVVSVNGQKLEDSTQLLQAIRLANDHQPQAWQIERNGQILDISITPNVINNEGVLIGKIDAYIGSSEMVTIRYDLLNSLAYGVKQSWIYTELMFGLIGKMFIGQASVDNLSGPIAIADTAGTAAKLGFIQYIRLLALISLSLGLLNLLPLPVLDGGQLVYLLIEAIRGKPLSEKVINNLQLFGVFLLILLMLIASMNDILAIGFRSNIS